MRRVAVVFVLAFSLIATVVPHAAADQPAPATPRPSAAAGALLLATPHQQGADLAAHLLVANGNGATMRSIDLPDPTDPPQRAMATALAGKALVETRNGVIFLVDATRGDAKRLDVPAGVQIGLPEWQSGRRRALFADPAGSHAALVDLMTGGVTDLATIASDFSLVLGGVVAPDDRSALITVGTGLWLVPTADPKSARPLGSGAYGGGFVDGGEAILYCQPQSSDRVAISLAPSAGGAARVVATAVPGARVLARPGSSGADALLAEPGRLSLLSLASGNEQPLPAVGGDVVWLRFAPSGAALLVGTQAAEPADAATPSSTNGDDWQWIDLKRGAARTLDDLAGQTLLTPDDGGRWLMFGAFPGPISGATGAALRSLDLETGIVRTVLATDDSSNYYMFPPLAPTADGRFALLSILPHDKPQLWLLDGERGAARLLTSGDGVAGAFSPDGADVAAGALTKANDHLTAKYTIESIDGATTIVRGSGLPIAWLRP